MFRCPPSRSTLSSSDILDFEQRFAARRTKGKTAKARLSPGPAHPTRLSVVPAEHNIGKQRAASSSSEATIHNEREVLAKVDTSSPSAEPAKKTGPTSLHQDNALGKLLHRPTLAATTPRRQVDSFYGTEQALNLRSQKHELSHVPPSLDGTVGSSSHFTPPSRSLAPWISRGNETLPEGDNDASSDGGDYSKTELPLLASARERRQHSRSQDVQLYKVPNEVHEMIAQPHLNNPQPHLTQMTVTAFQVPELVLPVGDSIMLNSMNLDPGAPVFMPRTRFGTVTGSSQDAPALQLSVFSNKSDLRLRSSSEQNAAYQVRSSRSQPPVESVEPALSLTALGGEGRIRRRSRTADQNIALPLAAPVLDRYPLMRPMVDGSEQLNIDVPNWPAHASSIHSQQSEGRHDFLAAPIREQASVQPRHVSSTGNNARGGRTFRAVSPALSTRSRSTPNLLQRPGTVPQFSIRRSSLPWNRIDSRAVSFDSVPSIASRPSSTKFGERISRQSSREALDAAAEFLCMRNSPLDDLTEHFSRISASRPRSVGRSWERPPRPRPSLLTGDPFGPGPPPHAPSSSPVSTIETVMRAEVQETAEQSDSSVEDVVALSLALPPSSPSHPSSIALPSTPQLHFSDPRSPRSPLDDTSTAKSTESSIKRKPVPAATTTPRVPVYDDSKPSSMQPQTPADVRGSKRRAKTRSDSSMRQLPIYVGQTMMSSPPPIPERHPHRNTYPAATSASSNVPISGIEEDANETHNRGHYRDQGRLRVQQSSQQAENDLDGHLHGLEEDRRVWFGRREGGNLDVTPPREGRFERYLS